MEDKQMTIRMFWKLPNKTLPPKCRVCREATAIVCRGEIPGLRGKAPKRFIINYDYFSKIK